MLSYHWNIPIYVTSALFDSKLTALHDVTLSNSTNSTSKSLNGRIQNQVTHNTSGTKCLLHKVHITTSILQVHIHKQQLNYNSENNHTCHQHDHRRFRIGRSYIIQKVQFATPSMNRHKTLHACFLLELRINFLFAQKSNISKEL